MYSKAPEVEDLDIFCLARSQGPALVSPENHFYDNILETLDLQVEINVGVAV